MIDDRTLILQEQARLFRELAARSAERPDAYEKLLAVADECDELAEDFRSERVLIKSSPTGLA